MSLVLEIVRAINRNGRQGPYDLNSQEVYGWVRQELPQLTFRQYQRILQDNAVPASERACWREAPFVVSSGGKYSLLKSTELELRPYVCAVVAQQSGLTSREILSRVRLLYHDYTTVDLMRQENLASPQDIIDQTIRNILVSNYSKRNNNCLFVRSQAKPYTYALTEKGYALAQQVEEIKQREQAQEVQRELGDSFSMVYLSSYSANELAEQRRRNRDFSYSEELLRTGSRTGCKTDPRLVKTRCSMAGYHCELNPGHLTFPTPHMPNYLEGHHIMPMNAQKNFPRINLDCIENLIALCPTCHRALHYGTPEVRRELLQRVLALREADLRGIGLTPELLELYYKLNEPL